MNNKARLIAISGICGAVAVCCILLVSVVPYVTLMLAVIASVAVVIPMLIDGRNLTYSLLVYAVSVVVSGFSGVFIGNIVYVAPVVLFCAPFAIVKVYAETFKFTRKVERTETLQDPFGQGPDRNVVTVELSGARRLPTLVKWILYYVLLEVGIVLTLLFTYLLTPSVFDALYHSNTLVFWLLVATCQLVVPLYDLLLRGCLIGASRVINKIVK